MPIDRRTVCSLVALTAGAFSAAACRSERRVGGPPGTEFILAAGDSTFWVKSGGARGGGLHIRGSPIQMVRFDGRFYELYSVDDDRSYFDAVLVGQRLYRRDLVAGDSAVVFEDTTIASLARWYGRQHPGEVPLEEDEEANESPSMDVSGELVLIAQFGPYLSFGYHVDGSVAGSSDWSTVRRGVVDLRTGAPVSVATLLGRGAAPRVVARGKALFSAALDSVVASRDARAREAAGALGEFRFDPRSFALVSVDASPAIQFAAVANGERAGGLTLDLAPIPIAAPWWWREVQASLPEGGREADTDRWRHGGVSVEAHYESGSEATRLALVDSGGHRWSVARIPAPAKRLYWLDAGQVDSVTLRALARAFDEAALYSEDARTASGWRRGAEGGVWGGRSGRGVRRAGWWRAVASPARAVWPRVWRRS